MQAGRRIILLHSPRMKIIIPHMDAAPKFTTLSNDVEELRQELNFLRTHLATASKAHRRSLSQRIRRRENKIKELLAGIKFHPTFTKGSK